MATLAVDTLKLARGLEAAEAIADAFVEGVATKVDIRELEAKIEQSRLQLEAKLAETKADLLKWFIGAVGFQIIAVLGGLIAILRLLPAG